jgi:hypothetical protein
MMLPPFIIRQDLDTVEGRTVMQAAVLQDVPVRRCALADLPRHQAALAAGAMPVGSVEFVREAMRLGNISEPLPMSYPIALDAFLGREVEYRMIEHLRGALFVKPVLTKLFTGFVWHENADDASYSEHDREQLRSLRKLATTTPVWASEVVQFLCEHRFYVHRGHIVGRSRYDPDGDEHAPTPDMAVVHAAIDKMTSSPHCPAAYGLDMGVLADGRTVLCEVNDGWALGYYGGSQGQAVAPKAYLAMLADRWSQLRTSVPHNRVTNWLAWP